MSDVLNKVKKRFTSEHTDENGHVSEVGYLSIANWAYWTITKRIGLFRLFKEYEVSGIVFDTNMQFKKENFDGDLVTIHLKINILEDNRKILRELDIYNEKNELTVKINSNGGFLDLNKRKIVEPPKEILDNCIKYLKE